MDPGCRWGPPRPGSLSVFLGEKAEWTERYCHLSGDVPTIYMCSEVYTHIRTSRLWENRLYLPQSVGNPSTWQVFGAPWKSRVSISFFMQSQGFGVTNFRKENHQENTPTHVTVFYKQITHELDGVNFMLKNKWFSWRGEEEKEQEKEARDHEITFPTLFFLAFSDTG